MGKLKKKLFEFFTWKYFNYSKISKENNIFKSQYMEIFEFRIFKVLNLLCLRFSNFVIFGLLNFKNVEIHILE